MSLFQLVAVPVSTTLIGVFVTAWLGPSGVRGYITDLVTADPTHQEQEVSRYVREVRKALPWQAKPTIYRPSVDFFIKHFDDFDPERPHPVPRVGSEPYLTIPQVVQEAPARTGSRFSLSGNLYGDPSMVTVVGPDVASVAFGIVDRSVRRVVVMCRAPMRAPLDFASGDRVTVSGLLIADGATLRTDGRGFDRVLYMACSSVAHSVHLDLVGIPPSAVKRKK